MLDRSSPGRPAHPDYDLDEQLVLATRAQYRALFDDLRGEIVRLLGERAATVSELGATLGRPKGTIGYHVKLLEDAGLVRVVRTKQVRAIEAKYYGRTARVFLYEAIDEAADRPTSILHTAAAELAAVPDGSPLPQNVNVRYARIPTERAAAWGRRLDELIAEFAAEPRGGEVTFGLVVGLYASSRRDFDADEAAP